MPHQPDMTYSPAYDQTQSQIVAAIRSSNPPHPDPSISPPSPPPPAHLPKQPLAASSATHDPHSLRVSQTSTVTATDKAGGSVSGSSSGSYPSTKGVVVGAGRSSFELQQQQQREREREREQQLQYQQQLRHHPLQQETVFAHPNQEQSSAHGSQYDGRRDSRGEKNRRSRAEGWSSPRSMSAGSPHRTHYRISGFPEDEDDQDDGFPEDPEENAFIILLKLSFLVPPYSVVAALYAFFVVLFTALISPLRLLPKSTPFAPSTSYPIQLTSLLVPPLHVHKSLIISNQSLPCHDNTSFSTNPYSYPTRLSGDSSSPNRNSSSRHIPPLPSPAPAMYSLPALIPIHLFSPILSIGLLLASWTAAFFWIFAMTMGNPDGTERRDDGRAAVLGVRNWWRAWLKRGG